MKPGQRLINLIKGKRKYILSAAIIKNLCAEHFAVTVEEMESKSRQREIVKARHSAMYLMKLFTNYTLERIAWEFLKRDHTSVLHALNVVKNSIAVEDGYLNVDIGMLENKCVRNESKLFSELNLRKEQCCEVPVVLSLFSRLTQ
jgi:chromosomal replication initiation ATPase DnaA